MVFLGNSTLPDGCYIILLMKIKLRDCKLRDWWFILIILLYFLSRLINLNRLPVFADEAIYIRWAQIMWHDAGQRFLPLSDGKPPLFMWLMIPFLKVIGDPLLAGRLLSVLSGFFTLIGSWFLSKKLFNQKTAFFSILLIVTSPFLLFYDRMALVDSFLTALGVWSFYLALLLFEKPKRDIAMFLGGLWGAAMLTKPTGVYFPILTPFLLLIYPFKKWMGKIKKLIIPGFLSSTFALGIYNVLRLSPAMHMISIRSVDYLRSKMEILTQVFQYFLPTSKIMLSWLISWLTWPTALFLIISLFLGIKKRNFKIGVLFLWCLIPFLVQAVIGRIIYPRYFLFITPFLLIIAGWCLEQLTRVKKFKFLAPAIIILLLIKPLIFDFLLLTKIEEAPLHKAEKEQYLETWAAGYGIKEASLFFQKQAKKQKIYVGTEGYFGTLPDGLLIYLGGMENIEIFGVGQPLGDIPFKLDEAVKKGPTYLLVNNIRLKFESDRLELIKAYPKPAGPKGQESLLLFKVKPE